MDYCNNRKSLPLWGGLLFFESFYAKTQLWKPVEM